MLLLKVLGFLLLLCPPTAQSFTAKSIQNGHSRSFRLFSSPSVVVRNPSVMATDEWELDCYSRPVMVGGKKLWEVLITDSSGSFRLCETLPSNK